MMTMTGWRTWLLGIAMGLSVAGTARAGILPDSGESQYELEFWESIKDSNHAEDYEAYLATYPNGRFAELAKARAARFAKPDAPIASTPPPVDAMDDEYEAVTAANVRTEPAANAALIGGLERGERVHVTGRTRNRSWYRVSLPNGTTGYVYHTLIREPVAAPPAPTATSKTPAATPEPAPAPAVTRQVAADSLARSFSDCDDCPEMVVVQPGSFSMGDNHGDRSEKPEHRVSLTSPFAIGKYEVTLAQWNACVKANACKPLANAAGSPDKTPARDISWTDAQRYARWLSGVTGGKYRLPSEAEWEYAARAGTGTRYWWGNTMQPGKANCKGCGGSWSSDAPADVDALPANPFGIHGMNGGVWEWVEDCWHKTYDGAPSDGSAWTQHDCRENVIRGGSWRNDSTYAHSASRFTYDTGVRYLLNGFRVAKSLTGDH